MAIGSALSMYDNKIAPFFTENQSLDDPAAGQPEGW